MGYHFREQDSFVRIVELTPALRKQIEDTIEHLLGILDRYDGDDDLEDSGDREPDLGWPNFAVGGGARMAGLHGEQDDREIEDEHDELDADSEPSLGWTLSGFMGTTFNNDECEEDFEGEDDAHA